MNTKSKCKRIAIAAVLTAVSIAGLGAAGVDPAAAAGKGGSSLQGPGHSWCC